jgi:hypothetical protein
VWKRLTTYNACRELGRVIRHKGEEGLDSEPNPFTRAERDRFLKDVKANERDGWSTSNSCSTRVPTSAKRPR